MVPQTSIKEFNVSKDLEIIKQLENKIGGKLTLFLKKNIIGGMDGYRIDESENVVALNLCAIKRTLDFSFLKNLRNLSWLGLTYCQISDISFIKGLMNLTVLYLNDNLISDVSYLKNLKNLTYLYLGNNHISDISDLKNLKKLKELNLKGNQIIQLPVGILDLSLEIKWDDYGHGGIVLKGNRIEKPPVEIEKKGIEAVKSYYKSLEGKRRTLNEVKVLLVGAGSAGKTSLVKRLMGDNFDKNEPQTHGINIKPWNVSFGKNIKIHFWDFGGQEIMHSTHLFFLSRRSFYLLVLDGRKDEKAEYWLQHIKSLGGNSPILVVINKIDQHPTPDVDYPQLQKKYKNIKRFAYVSCATGAGIEDLSQLLIAELQKVELPNIEWSAKWFDIKRQLEDMDKDYINYDEYKTICEKAGVKDKTSQNTLAEYLNDMGAIVHFEDFQLGETHILNPEWITTAVYKIINSKKLADSRGLLALNQLDEILKMGEKNDYYYPRKTYRYIIELMQKFELCFAVDSETILLPAHLEIPKPTFEFDYTTALKFVVAYDFLPKSIIPRFMVKMHKDIKDELHWRTGVVLEDKTFNCTAVIKSDEHDKKIFIYVNGDQRVECFSVIRKTLLNINSSFEVFGYKESVPCNCEECTNSEYPHFFSYEFIMKCKKNERTTVICQESTKDVDIKDLLSGIESPKNTSNNGWDVFLSYSSEDISTIKKIVSDLNKNGISYWWDVEQILPWHVVLEKIEEGLKKSRFVIPCFSHNQVKSSWCRAEYTSILDEIFSRETDRKLIPLIIDNLEKKDLPLLVKRIKHTRLSDRDSYQALLNALKKKHGIFDTTF